jgi:protein-S-isoprenylcysteine O-methyltransferase Ste14
MDNLLRIFLPIYVLLYVALAFVWRSYLVWKRTGVNPYALGSSDSAHDFIGRVFTLTLIMDALVIGVYAFVQGGYTYFMPIFWLESPLLVVIGVVLLVVSLLWILLAQAQMGASWRIGIDSAHKTELVRHGMYRWSRNPIFLGMRATSLGFFLVLPNAATFAALLLSEVLVQIQVRLEEEHLTGLHGDEYREYCQLTPRWL